MEELGGGSGCAGGDGLVSKDYCLGFEACICEIGRFGACFADFQLGLFEVFSLVVLFLCAGAHGTLWRTKARTVCSENKGIPGDVGIVEMPSDILRNCGILAIVESFEELWNQAESTIPAKR